QSPVPTGLIKVPLFHRTAFLERSKIGQIGTLGGYIHFLITICENSNFWYFSPTEYQSAFYTKI
ncbi:MAG: hypothetical protein IJA36_02425, partial [Lachnospiraceae bacterium]|nr:hypothetical protein [Lachnospiraceae bacterium]